MPWKARVTLFNSQCLALYGSQLLRLDDRNIKKLCTTWKKCCRILLNLSPMTRSYTIHHLMGTAPILDSIMNRMLNFYLIGLNNEDDIINFFFRNSLLSNSSYVATNISKILGKF